MAIKKGKIKNIVLFLGAGSSRVFGYPLTSQILTKTIEKINDDTLFTDHGIKKKTGALYRKLLQELLTSLSPGLRIYFGKKVKLTGHEKLPLVTDLLSQVDHAIANSHDLMDWNFELNTNLVFQPSSINSRWDLKSLKMLFEWAITEVIYSPSNDNPVIDHMIKWIKKNNSGRKVPRTPQKFVTIITSNYDFSIEDNLLEEGEAHDADTLIDYGFSWRDTDEKGEGLVFQRPSKPRFRILKLHGSTDWLKCERCGHIYINPCFDIYPLAFVNYKTNANSCHCNFWPLKPVLVTPSYIRNNFDTNLHEIWKAAMESLRRADKWIIAGYSLPNEDLNIKSLLLRSFHGRNNKPEIDVVQFGCDSKYRFNNFFGENNFNFHSEGLEKFKFG